MNFNSENIELFLTVLDTGSFSAAARKLNRVPSAVSMAIANIEAELGYHLFERTHRKVISYRGGFSIGTSSPHYC